MSLITVTGDVNEGSGFTVLGRIVGYSGAAVTQATISSIAYQISYIYPDPQPPDFEEPATPVILYGPTSLGNVSDLIYDTLQTDSRWTIDATGYNFAGVMPPVEDPDRTMSSYPGTFDIQVDVQFTPSSGNPFVVQCKPITVSKTQYGRSG